MKTNRKAFAEKLKMHIVVPVLYVAVLIALLVSSIIN